GQAKDTPPTPPPVASTAPDPSAEAPKLASTATPPKPDVKPPPAKIVPPKKPDEKKPDEPKKIEPPKPDVKLPPLPDPKKPEKPPEKKPDEPKPPEPKKEPLPLPPPESAKVAVQQLQKEDEPDNKDAQLLAEKSHKVDPGKETRATITSLTENNPDPSAGTHAGTPGPDPGTGDKDVAAQDKDHKGEHVAPDVIPLGVGPHPEKSPDPPKAPGKASDGPPAVAGDPRPPGPEAKVATAGVDGKGAAVPIADAPPIVAGTSGDPMPTGGATSVTPGVASSKLPPGTGDGTPKVLPQLASSGKRKTQWTAGLGLGAKGDDGKPTIALTEPIAHAVIGRDELDRLRHVDAETRESKHKSEFRLSSLSRWKPAMENYIAGVKPGNTTELGTRASPFATYLTQIHNRLHPIFADGFLESLSSWPATNPINDLKIVTKMEIVLKADGTIHHLGIVKPSGVTAFDLGALDAVDRASPFGKPPDVIVSPDGLVYLHWEFHRDDIKCSTLFAFPYILREGETPKTPGPLPPLPAPPVKEETPKTGMLLVPSTWDVERSWRRVVSRG
ncbi:MAG: TonB C-terminal domain-containing protein, partial [Polyangiales bacterium]